MYVNYLKKCFKKELKIETLKKKKEPEMKNVDLQKNDTL